MRKIIHSIGIALILSVILVLIFPTCILRGDAGWTYLGGTARVDVAFAGNIKKGRVKAQGANTRIIQPKWFSNNNFQGTVVEFPVSYRKKTYQIKLTPQADEWGKDSALVIKFRGEDFKHKGKRRPAWVIFQNISLNGKPVAAEKRVWHDQPFILPYSAHVAGISLSYDVCKPFSTSDISFKNLLTVFLACLMLCLFLVSPSKAECHIPRFVSGKNIVNFLSDAYRHIDPVFRRSFWIIFGVLCFAFGFHTICFMWGNHDWSLLDSNQRWLALAWNGRYMINAVKIPLSNGIYLPLIYDLIIFITLAINAVLLCRYWCLEKRIIYYVLCGLVLTAQPFTLSMMYFLNMTPEVFIGETCVLAALILSENVATRGGYTTRTLVYSLLSIVMINFALAMYPVLITTIAVAFTGRLLVQFFDWDGSWQRLRSYLRAFMIPATNIVLGIVLYKLITTFVFPTVSSYNTETLPLHQVPERLGVLFKQCFHQLCEYEYPFISQWILWVFLGFTLVLALFICSMGSRKQRVVRLFLFLGALFATQTAMIIAKTHVIDGRIELFGLVPFETLIMVLIITKFRQIHNLWVITGVCIISSSIVNDLDCLRAWKLGFDAEKMLWNRVLARLETQKDFRLGRKYDIVGIGDHSSISLRKRYYTGPRKKFHNDARYMLNYSYDDNYRVFVPYEFYYPVRFLSPRKFPFAKKYTPQYVAVLKRLYQAGVLQRAEVWPKPNGLIVWKNIILFVTDGKELDNYRKKFERELGGKRKGQKSLSACALIINHVPCRN